MAQVNQSFGSTSGLDSCQLVGFFQYLQRSIEGPLPVKKVATCSGMQPDGSCVINREIFLSSASILIDCDETQYTCGLIKNFLVKLKKIRSVDIYPSIMHPLSTEPQ